MKNKSTEGLSFPMSLTNTICSYSWLIYSFCINDIFMIIPNTIASILNSFQIILFIIYPSKSPSKDK